jgi:phosphatidylserine/phosphatidylglycerophosphate/cardiolipin synthase-like enzyme
MAGPPFLRRHFQPQVGKRLVAHQLSIAILRYPTESGEAYYCPLCTLSVRLLVKLHIEVILDKSQWTEKYSGATYLANHKIPVLIDDKHAIAHNKVMIIDGNTVITGSFNFTKAAEEKNAENVIVLKDNPALAQRYAQNWRTHAKHSVAYTGPRVHQADSDRSKPQPGNAGFACGNKTKCSQMISCEEARFYLTRCSAGS